MKLFFDLFPVILFFIVFKLGEANPEPALALGQQSLAWLVSGGQLTADQAPILLATAAAILATAAQVAWMLLRRERVHVMLWISLAIIVVFGGATIYLHDDHFIKMKPTVLYWLFSLVLFLSPVLLKKNLIRAMMGAQLSLPEPVWSRLNIVWSAFFLLMGGLNLVVAFHFSRDIWVNFKVFGFMGLMLAFIVGQSLFLARYMKEPE